MKKLLCFATIFFTVNITIAELPSIVALVNNEPITLHEFRARKQTIIALHNRKNLDSKLDKAVITGLINEFLLFQHAKNIKISNDEINKAIEEIDEQNKRPKNYSIQLLESKSIDINSYKSQIKAALIQRNIFHQLSRSVIVTPKEIDATIFTYNRKDAEISAQIFTSKNKDDKTLRKMYNLQKNLKSCRDVKEPLYANFATVEIIETNLRKLDPTLQTIISDLNIGQTSSVFEMKEGFKLVSLGTKKIIDMSYVENKNIVTLLANQKLVQIAQKFSKDLYKQASIKVMLPYDITFDS